MSTRLLYAYNVNRLSINESTNRLFSVCSGIYSGVFQPSVPQILSVLVSPYSPPSEIYIIKIE